MPKLKTCETSRKMRNIYLLPYPILLFILLTILCICSMVTCLFRKLNWWSGISLWFSIIMEILGSRSFLNNFDRASNKLVGLYLILWFWSWFARLLDHNNLYYLSLGWKEVPSKDCITLLDNIFYSHFWQIWLVTLIGYRNLSLCLDSDFYYSSHFFNSIS